MFQDITTLLLDRKAFRDTIDLFVERYKDHGITVVAGNVYLCNTFFSSDDLTMKKKGQNCKQRDQQPYISHILLPWKTGVEARGFIFGPPIALAIGAKFVPLRKPKKLPGLYIYH